MKTNEEKRCFSARSNRREIFISNSANSDNNCGRQRSAQSASRLLRRRAEFCEERAREINLAARDARYVAICVTICVTSSILIRGWSAIEIESKRWSAPLGGLCRKRNPLPPPSPSSWFSRAKTAWDRARDRGGTGRVGSESLSLSLSLSLSSRSIRSCWHSRRNERERERGRRERTIRRGRRRVTGHQDPVEERRRNRGRWGGGEGGRDW